MGEKEQRKEKLKSNIKRMEKNIIVYGSGINAKFVLETLKDYSIVGEFSN